MNFKFLIIIFFTLLYSNYGGGPNAFYKTPFTPREIAMGETGVASADNRFGIERIVKNKRINLII